MPETHIGEKMTSSTNGAGKTEHLHAEEMKLDHFSDLERKSITSGCFDWKHQHTVSGRLSE